MALLRVAVITLFPEIIESYFQAGVVTRAAECGLELHLIPLRNFGKGPHQKVDDRPYGGGPGMVLRADVLEEALILAKTYCPNAKVIAFSPTGNIINQKLFYDCLPTADQDKEFIFLAGRYEGFDQRFIDLYVNESWSLGEFVLSGGEIPVLACLDGFARLLPGVLNKAESFEKESFSSSSRFDYPHYTRPAVFHGLAVPDILLSGHHENIEKWRQQQSILLEQQFIAKNNN